MTLQESKIEDVEKPTSAILEKIKKSVYPSMLLGSLGFVFLGIVFFSQSIQPPGDFPVSSTIVFEKNQPVGQLVDELHDKKYIKYKSLFKVFLRLSGRDGSVKAGTYYFEAPIDVSTLAHRFASGQQNLKGVRITIPEGSTNSQIAEIINKKYENINQKDLLKLMSGKEGMLFPETYFFDTETSAEYMVNRMNYEYHKKIDPLFESVGVTDIKTQKSIIVMASLLEEEGKTLEDKQKIAGVLLRRLRIGMPLQVDATINYIKGEATRVTFNDLERKSIYNTYQNKGLPPAPISNPGLVSIQAALSPVDTGALYYLTGKNGIFYFSKTFEEHVRNKERYLR